MSHSRVFAQWRLVGASRGQSGPVGASRGQSGLVESSGCLGVPPHSAPDIGPSRGGSVPLPGPTMACRHGSRRLPPRRGASRSDAWRERPAPGFNDGVQTREPEAPATTRRKPPGRVAGASRSRVRFREPEAPATTRRKPPGRVAGASRSRIPLREPEAPATTRRKPPGRVAGASRSRIPLREPEAPATTRRKRAGHVAGSTRRRMPTSRRASRSWR
jgi:hypothetical protein